ncbi:MAG: hypothetical protein JXA14_23565 [Anaerolineae bacterium]|nr:hypothetical protein [Anaerolineae bacterium]
MQGIEHPTIQRTLVITCDDGGAEVGRLLTEMLEEWGSPPVVRTLAAWNGLKESGGADRTGDWHSQDLDDALIDISRLSHRISLQQLGFRLDRLGELAIWVVGTDEEHVAAGAHRAAARAEALLTTDALVMGIVMRDVEGSSDNGPSNGNGEAARVASPLDSEMLAAFSGPCYLVTLLNEAGLALDGPDELHQRVARFLALHICTGLRDIPVWLSQGEPWTAVRVCPSFGLVWVAWPGEVAQARAVEVLKAGVLSWLVDREPALPAAQTLENVAPAPALLTEPLTPLGLAEAVHRAAMETQAVTFADVLQPVNTKERHPLLVRWEGVEAACTAAASPTDTSWDARLTAVFEDRTTQARAMLSQILDTQGLSAALVALRQLRQRIGDWIESVGVREDEITAGLTQLESQASALWLELEAQLARMPRRRFRHMLHLAIRPFTLLWVIQQWRKIAQGHQRYLHLRAAILSAQVSQRQMQQARSCYEALNVLACEQIEALETLAAEIRSALAPSPNLPDWPMSSLLLPEDPDQLLTALMADKVAVPAVLAEQVLAELGPLSTWLEEGAPDRSAISVPLWRATEPLIQVSLTDVVQYRIEYGGDVREWLWELDVQAAPFWRWEPATLSEADRAGLGLVRLSLMAPDLVNKLSNSGDGSAAPGHGQTVPFEMPDRMAFINLRRGIPAE